MGILRLGHVEIRVPDLELATAYYTEVLGLIETDRAPGRVFLKAWDEHDHHSVVLQYAPRYGLDHMAFKVESADDLAELESRAEQYGCRVHRLSTGDELAQGEAIRFLTPSGHEFELFHQTRKVGNGLSKTNPAMEPEGLRGIHPPRIDHLLVTAEEVGDAASFYVNVLGFRLTEQVINGHGHQLGVWLERSHTPHDLAIITGPNGGLHHFAFWVDDWNQIGRAADILAYNGLQIDVGPTRHGITRGQTLYFFDPCGNRNEVFTGGYYVDPDFEPITWTEDQIGRAIFYYEGKLNDRFVSVTS
jgi:catechol 2,3-dioxygenase